MAIAQQKTRLPPGPQAGEMAELRHNPLVYWEYLYHTYGDMVTVSSGNMPVVLLFRPEHVRYLLIEQAQNFTTRELNRKLHDFLGEGLLTLNGEKHRQHRRLLQPAFHKKRIESYAPIMVQYTLDMLDQWQPGATIDLARALRELTLRIIVKCLCDTDLAAHVRALGQAFVDVAETPPGFLEQRLGLHIDLPMTRYGKRMAATRQINALIYPIIAAHQADGRDRGDVLSLLLTGQIEGSRLSYKQVRDHIITLISAGHDTTTDALVWTFYLLAEHPDVRAKLRQELHTVLAGRPPTLMDVPNLIYTEWVLNEAMRLYSPSWLQSRCAIEAFELDGYRFPPRTIAIVSAWVTHRRPDLWEEATAFRPERWDPVNGQKVPLGAYFPFGAGPRTCIGMPLAMQEMKLLLATILQRYTPRLVPGYRLEPMPVVTLHPKHGMPVILEPA